MSSVTGGAYYPLDFARNEIRVVAIEQGRPSETIRCAQEHVSLDQLPRYQALPYVRGDQGVRSPVSGLSQWFHVQGNHQPPPISYCAAAERIGGNMD